LMPKGEWDIYLSCVEGTMNFMYLDLEQWLVVTLNSYVCKTMWAWDF
jgi:hypothetical protein